jgi:hypothetical protein
VREMDGSGRLVWYLSQGTFRYIVAAVSWTPIRRQRPRTGWSAALSAAVRWPRRWFTVRRLVWLLCIGFSVFVIWGAGTHLGPGLRAAHGQGITGRWIAQQQDSGKWSGEFVSTSGTVTLPNVSYAGSLSAVQPGTSVPALDAGAGDEVYPLTGSDKWIRDLIGVVAGTLALIGLLARGLFVARRRRRAPPADYLTQAVTQAATPRERTRRRRPTAPNSRVGKLGLLAVGGGATGWASAKFILLLADVRPYAGWYWLLAVAGGIVIAVALPWALVRAARSPARWTGWLLLGYTIALVFGLRYYLSVRFTPPSSVPAALPAPPPQFVLEIAGLSAEALTLVAVTLLILAVMVEVTAPGPVGGWLRARRKPRPPTQAPAKSPDQGAANTADREA